MFRWFIFALIFVFLSCQKDHDDPLIDDEIIIDSVFINNVYAPDKSTINSVDFEDVNIRIRFHSVVDTLNFNKEKLFITGGIDTNYRHHFHDNLQNLFISFLEPLESLSFYRLLFDQGTNLGGRVSDSYSFVFITRLDSTPKFPAISEDSLLNLVQRRTFEYFWDYGHPVSGLSRDRLGGGDVVTSGGSGFGVMAILTGIERGFITRSQGFERISKMVDFLLKPATEKYHGALPHWLNGATGSTIPFSAKDDGGDLVETSFLMQGLITAKQYFIDGNPEELALCDSIQKIWEGVEWDWYRNGGQNRLFWHWSETYGWQMNMPVTGWNEALIVYVLAAASPTHSIPAEVYDQGWARAGAINNGDQYYGITLPLGEPYGGPLFFAHYSFLGLDPRNLEDKYAGYMEQNTAHARINHAYSADNPENHAGYSAQSWGLTASDIPSGYTASSPLNDVGVIAPTAALASFPYTPEESMEALKFFYYILGDRLWGVYGFYDAFSLDEKWFASSYLAIDQGPIICMIENYRTGLLWDLFMSNQEIASGLTKLGFTW